ncbi:MAG: putative metal-binding motif-containing protein [Myxococcales bacterium]|nr:putative metal-binding motif-containing protein [Myxococcales bacterium]
MGAVALAWLGCNGPNNDDLTVTDADADADTDADSDIDADSDGFTSDVDCNDQNRNVNPNAPELCDGFDNNCNTEVDELGGVSFVGNNAGVDRTAEFSKGTKEDPVVIQLQTDGTLNVCPGTWYVGLDIDANVRVLGRDSATTTLDGGGAIRGIWVDESVNVGLTGVTLTGFVDDDEGQLGAALHCDGAQIMASDIVFEGDPSNVYGGYASLMNGCVLQLGTSAFNGGSAQYGGQLAMSNSRATLLDVTFDGGTASVAGGAVAVASDLLDNGSDATSFACTGCTFENGVATDPTKKTTPGGGALWIGEEAEVTLTGTELSDNSADGPGGAVLLDSLGDDSAELETLEDTEFDGNTAAGGANDVSVPAVKGGDYEITETDDLSCDESAGCR